jgi:hypothetical protein
MNSVELKEEVLKCQVFDRLRQLKLSKEDVRYCFENGFRQGNVIVSVTKPFANCMVCPPDTPAEDSIGVILAWVNRIK